MAVFGLAICVASVILVNWSNSNKALEKINLDREKLRYETERDYDTSVLKSYNDQIEALDNSPNPDLKLRTDLVETYNKLSRQYFDNEKDKVLDSEYTRINNDVKL